MKRYLEKKTTVLKPAHVTLAQSSVITKELRVMQLAAKKLASSPIKARAFLKSTGMFNDKGDLKACFR